MSNKIVFTLEAKTPTGEHICPPVNLEIPIPDAVANIIDKMPVTSLGYRIVESLVIEPTQVEVDKYKIGE